MVRGTVKWFDCKRGYGFVNMPQDDRDIFVHYSHIEGEGFRSLRHGDEVDFDLVETDRGPQAHAVRPAPARKRPGAR
jgi:CspA family cold shock protein